MGWCVMVSFGVSYRDGCGEFRMYITYMYKSLNVMVVCRHLSCKVLG